MEQPAEGGLLAAPPVLEDERDTQQVVDEMSAGVLDLVALHLVAQQPAASALLLLRRQSGAFGAGPWQNSRLWTPAGAVGARLGAADGGVHGRSPRLAPSIAGLLDSAPIPCAQGLQEHRPSAAISAAERALVLSAATSPWLFAFSCTVRRALLPLVGVVARAGFGLSAQKEPGRDT